MKNHKTLIAFIALGVLVCIFIGITLYTSILSYMEVSSQAELKVSGMIDTLNRVQEHIDSLDEEFRERTANSMEMMCIALRPLVHGDTFDGPGIFEDGVVVRVDKGEVIYPDGFTGSFELLTEAGNIDQLDYMTGTTLIDGPEKTRPVLISARQIEGSFYYIDWWEMDDYYSSINYEKQIGEAVKTLEQLYDASLLLVEESENGPAILYASKALGAPERIEDLGLSSDVLDAENANLTINKKTYTATYENIRAFDRSAKAVVLLNPIANNSYVLNCIVIAAGFILISMSALILWVHWIDVYVKDHKMTENQEKAWQPSRMRKTSAAMGINGAIILFVLLIGYQLLGNLSRISESNQDSLEIIMARLENDSKEVAEKRFEEEDWGVYTAGRIADLYSRVPGCRNEEFLKKACDLLHSEYIMVFDENGKELIASNGYVGFTLGDGINTNTDFRYLLQGIDRIICEPETEKFSGKRIQMMGTKMDLGIKDAYGAVLLAIDPQTTWETAGNRELENYINMLTPQKNLSIIVSQESGKVVYSSDPELIDKEPVEFGMEYSSDSIPTSLETFEVLGIKKFGAYNEDEQYRYFYMIDADNIWGDSLRFSIFSAVFYILVCLVISLMLLGSSRVDITMETELLKEKLKQKPNFSVDQEVIDTFREDQRGDRSIKEWWHDMTPEQKIGQTLKIVITMILIMLFIILLNKDKFGSRSVIYFILRGSWKRGLNELSIAAIICCLVILITAKLFKDLLVRAMFSMLNAKGKTIVGLVSSLIQYIAIITTIFFCLAYLGFDTSVLLTSASILTLAISLGSKDLVADILSGIFIIFEGDFQVGDVIEVNGFRGKVLDIGVRSTKLKNSSNNIKIIDNQNVKNILNLSKQSTWLFLDLTISITQPLEEIEAMLDRELPKIGEQIPEIISGPYYFGISEIGYHRLKISFGATCHQNDAKSIKPTLNHALWELFSRNGIQL